MALFDLAAHIAEWLEAQSNLEETNATSVKELGLSYGSTVGHVRKDNQDRLLIAQYAPQDNVKDGFLLIALCDGIGGGRDGGWCASVTLGTVLYELIRDKTINPGRRLSNACIETSRLINKQYLDKGGTTFSGIIISPANQIYAVNVGDSRIYRFSKENNGANFHQVTEDDTIAGELAKIRGKPLTDENKERFSNQLAQYIGAGDGIEPREYNETSRAVNSSYIITSDGAHNIPQELLGKIIKNSPSSLESVKRTIHISRWTGGYDNASIISIPETILNDYSAHSNNSTGLLQMWANGGMREILITENMNQILEKDAISSGRRAKEEEQTTPSYTHEGNEQSNKKGKKSIVNKKKDSANKEKRNAQKNQNKHAEDEKNKQLNIEIESVKNSSKGGTNGPA